METSIDTDRLDLYIEALIFASESAIRINDISAAVHESFGKKFDKNYIEKLVDQIKGKYDSDEFAIELVAIAGGYAFLTKNRFHKIIADHLKLNSKKKLSRAAMETLSIVAYKQPITKVEIESIRGVSCDYSLQKLLEKGLIEISGREQGPGRPLLYATTIKFLDHFGIKDSSELPQLKEIATVENSIGHEEE